MRFDLLCVLALTFACAACGNKGPLYLPQQPGAKPAKAQPPAPATDDSKAPASGAKP